MSLLFVGAGGFLGAVSRYLASEYISSRKIFKGRFSPGIMIVNTFGTFLLGLFPSNIDANVLLFFTEGFLSSFTTFSTFMGENAYFYEKREYWKLVLYIFGNIVLAALFFKLGRALQKI